MQMYFRIRHFDRYVGILVVLAVVLAALAVVFLARGQQWFAKRSPYKVVFSKVQGLKPGTPVTISGMEVGNLKSLQLTPQSQVELVIEVLEKYRGSIRQDSQATVSAALLGGKSIEITVGSPEKPLLPAGSTIASQDPKEITDLLKEIDFKTPLKKVEEILDNLKSLSAKLNSPKGELSTTLRNLKHVTSQLKEGRGNVGKILQDPDMHGEITEALSQLRRTLTQVEEISRNAARVSRELPRMAEEVDRSIQEVPQILSEVKKAASGLAPILEDVRKTTPHAPAIAQNLKEITQEGKTAVKDVREITGSVKQASPEIPDLLTSTRETVEEADKLIQGLQNHWLIRGSMGRAGGETSLAVSQRESPYEKTGEPKR